MICFEGEIAPWMELHLEYLNKKEYLKITLGNDDRFTANA